MNSTQHKHRHSKWIADTQGVLLFDVHKPSNDLTPNGRYYRYCLDCQIVTDKRYHCAMTDEQEEELDAALVALYG